MRPWSAASATLLAFGVLLAPETGAAQGLTGAALEGLVVDSAGRPVAGAAVEVLQTATGERWLPRLSAEGRFVLEHVSAGGPYRVTARAIGYRPVVMDGVTLASGQRERLTLVLVPSAATLDELRVTEVADRRLGAGRTGPERTLDQGEVARFPNSQRNLVNLGAPGPAPLVFAFNGWNSQLTAYQVDGGQGADLYEGAHTGRGVFGSPVPLEAIEEVRLQSAPYDVRSGQLSSGQFTLTTLRAGDRWTGSAYGVFQNEHLVSQASTAPPFTAWTTGAAITGPLIRNRLSLALVADYTTSTIIDRGPLVTDTAGNADSLRTGIQYESAERFRRILADQWGLDAGTLGASNSDRPRLDLWAKLGAQLGRGGVLDLSQRVASGYNEGTIVRGSPSYRTGSTTRRDQRDILETRAAWRVQPGGRWANEMVAGVRSLRTRCRPAGAFPRIEAAADAGSLSAGADSTCTTTDIRQLGVELSEHASIPTGRHVLTAGLHAEWNSVEDPTLTGSQGTWLFESLDALETGRAFLYERTLPGPLATGLPSADFDVWWLSWYLQDRVRLGNRIELTIGVRGDLPILPDEGATNPAVLSSLGLATGRPPDARPLWSPRAAVSWDVTGRGTTWVRAGAGSFTGRPPYQWLSGIYQGSGGEQALLSCRGGDVPPFNPLDQPTECGSGARASGQINVYDPGLRFPQIAQASLGVDQRLPGGFSLSADLLAGRSVSQFRFSDANLAGPVGTATGEAGRPLYGALSSDGSATVARRDPSLGGPVVLVDRGRGDRTLTASVLLQRPFDGTWGFDASYRWNESQDYQSPDSSDPLLNLGGTPLEGTHASRTLGRSLFHNRHRVFGQVTLGGPLGAMVSVIYVGNSGNPYSYVIQGDANADGMGSASTGFNDLVYVPRDVRPGGDIRLVGAGGVPAGAAAYATLDSIIEAEPCLHSRRGALARRNGCTNPWVQFTNARLEVGVPTFSRQRATLTVDVYNLPNLLNGDWGRQEQVTARPTYRLLRLVGWDGAAGRGIYQLLPPPTRQLVEATSRWRLQFTARYRF